MIDNLNTDMGSRIRALRDEKDITRERLAEKAEISTQFLADLELGYKGMSAATLYKLSRALCVSSDYLLFGNKNNKSGITDIFNVIPDNKKESAKQLLTVFADAVNS